MSSTQQIRDNSAKPKLSYFFTNGRGLERAKAMYVNDWVFGPEVNSLDSAVEHINEWLAAGPGDPNYKPLVDAFCEVVAELEETRFGERPEYLRWDGTFVQFIASAVNALDEYCDVCAYGANKYARGNYRLGAPVTEYLDSTLRHLLACIGGDETDVESDCLHLGLAMWNLWQALDQPAFRDDRLPAVYQETLTEMIDDSPPQRCMVTEVIAGVRGEPKFCAYCKGPCRYSLGEI